MLPEQTEMEKCTIYHRDGKRVTISCKLGLWQVEGNYGLTIINEATRYFLQYKAGGEYSDIIGGKSVVDLIREMT